MHPLTILYPLQGGGCVDQAHVGGAGVYSTVLHCTHAAHTVLTLHCIVYSTVLHCTTQGERLLQEGIARIFRSYTVLIHCIHKLYSLTALTGSSGL
jgi:hypothetical protein